MAVEELGDLEDNLTDLAFPEDCQEFNFHILEHILLRPKNNQEDFLIPFEYFTESPIEDPYSFWITVITPAWHNAIMNDNDKYQFEQVLRRETPAHIAIRFIYLDSVKMEAFENAYLNWLHDLAKYETDPQDLRDSKNELIKEVNSFRDLL